MVADVRHRLHHIDGQPKNWPAFFAAAGDDPPLAEGIALAHDLASRHDLAWLTGRPERLRPVTVRWLSEHGLPTGPLHMRRSRDFRPARVTKLETLRRMAEQQAVAVVVDDDPAVVEAVRAVGLTVRLADWVPYRPSLQAAQEDDGRT